VGLFEQQELLQKKAMLKDVFACLDLEEEVPITPQEKEFRVLILRPQALIV